MRNKIIFHGLLFLIIFASKITNVNAADPILLVDLGRQKEISNFINKEPSLSKILKQEHNLVHHIVQDVVDLYERVREDTLVVIAQRK